MADTGHAGRDRDGKRRPRRRRRSNDDDAASSRGRRGGGGGGGSWRGSGIEESAGVRSSARAADGGGATQITSAECRGTFAR